MKDWVQEFLLRQGDEQISKESLEREVAVIPFCHRRLSSYFNINFSSNVRLVEIFGSVLAALPFPTFQELALLRNLFFSFTDKLAHVQGMNSGPERIGALCTFSGELMGLSVTLIRATIAHELAHISLGHYKQEMSIVEAEVAADELAKSWGFEFEIQAIRSFLKSKPQI